MDPNTGQPDPSLNLAQPALYSYLYDPQGSVTARQAVHLGADDGTDHQHFQYEVLDERAYDAFGERRGMAYGSTPYPDPSARYTLTSAWGQAVLSSPDWAASGDPVGFGGQWGYRYQGGGLSLLGHRYYDATTGRFLTRDPIGYNGGINLYGFVGNNPVNGMDPEGTQDEDNPLSYLGAMFDHASAADWLNVARHNPVVKALRSLGNVALNVPLPENPAADVRAAEEVEEAATIAYRAFGQVGRSTRIQRGFAMIPGASQAVPGGLRNASQGLKMIFADGSVKGKSIISIREILLKNGFTQTKARGSGYLFTNKIGEEVRIMSRNGGWDARIRNRGGGWLDEFGNQATGKGASHGIDVYSK